MAAIAKRIGRIAPASSVLFVCDVQEVFRNSIYQMPTVVHGTNSLVRAAKVLDIPIVVTTQYAARLGDTVAEINKNLEDAARKKVFDKTLFSMMTDEVIAHVENGLGAKPKSVILCGIEGHVCVLQTCLDLLERGYDVHVVADAVSSSTSFNRDVSLEVCGCVFCLAMNPSALDGSLSRMFVFCVFVVCGILCSACVNLARSSRRSSCRSSSSRGTRRTHSSSTSRSSSRST